MFSGLLQVFVKTREPFTGLRTKIQLESNKGRTSKFREGSLVRQTTEEGREDISVETLWT